LIDRAYANKLSTWHCIVHRCLTVQLLSVVLREPIEHFGVTIPLAGLSTTCFILYKL